MDNPASWARLIGGSIVAGALAWMAFSRPSWVRSTSSRWRYDLGAALHALLYATLFWIIASVFAKLVREPLGSTGPAWAGLMGVLVVLGVAPLSRPPRAWLQRHVARAPREAQRLARRLSEVEYQLDPTLVEEASTMLQRRGVDVKNDWLPITKPAHQLMLRATVLFSQMLKWEESGRYRAFLDEARIEFDALRQRFDRLTLMAARALSGIERVGEIRLHYTELAAHTGTSQELQIDRPLRALVNDLNAHVCENATSFYRDACLLCGRAVLSAHRSSRQRTQEFAAMGFRIEEERVQSGLRALAQGLLVLTLGLIAYFSLAPRIPTKVFSQDQLFLVIVCTQLAALACGIVPKLHFGFANAGLSRRTPLAFMVGAGLGAVASALLFNTAGGWLVGGWSKVSERLHEVRFILASPFVTAACTAWLVQDHRWRRVRNELGRRYRDGLVFGGCWLAVSSMLQALALLQGLTPTMPALTTLALNLAYSFCFGGALGLAVPYLVRRSWPGPAEDTAGPSGDNTAHAEQWPPLVSSTSAGPITAVSQSAQGA